MSAYSIHCEKIKQIETMSGVLDDINKLILEYDNPCNPTDAHTTLMEINNILERYRNLCTTY